MKLNLLPTTEKKSRQGRTGVLVGTLIVVGSIIGYAALTFIPAKALNDSKAAIGDLPQQVATADATAKSADVVIASAADVIKNAQLAKAMIDHNDDYIKLYDDVKRYIPPYYRLQSIQATPLSATQSQVTLTGTLAGYQRYADLMLALYRFKDAQSILRSGYNLDDPIVPALTPADQTGKMRRQNEAPVPDDGLERLAYFQGEASSAPSGYLGTGGYGSGQSDVRGALPNASVVTIQMVVNRNLQTPLAADTLRGGAGGAAPATGFPGGPGGPGGLPGGFPGRPAGIPPGGPPAGNQGDR